MLSDIKKNIYSPKFLISIFLVFLLCLLSDAPSVSARVPLSVLDEIVKMRREIWLEKGVRFSAPSVFFGFDYSIWYSVILPVIAAFPVIYNFSDEWFGDNYIMTLSRSGYKKYTIWKFLSAFITGFMTAILGLLLFGITVSLIFPSVNEFENAEQLYLNGAYAEPAKAIAAKVINNSLICGFYAVFAIFLCLIIKDKFFSLSVLMVINYFSMKLEIKFMNSEAFLNNEEIRWLRIFFPNCQKDMYYFFPDYFDISFYYYIPIVISLCLGISAISFYLIKRRYRYGS